jgi:hypothetical protein
VGVKSLVAAGCEGLFNLHPVGTASGEAVDDVARVVAAQLVVGIRDADREAACDG